MTGDRRHAGRLLLVTVGALLSLALTVPGLDVARTGRRTDGADAERTVTVPKKGAYLGAFVNTPGTKKGGTFEVLLTHLPAFTQQMGRRPAIVPAYQPWAKAWVRNDNLTTVAEKYGAIPMLSWHCGAPDAEIAAGVHDALITRFAKQLKAYGRPVFLRWYWESNISMFVYPACLGPGPLADQAKTYVAAYRRIVDIFDREQVDNVASVWSVSTLSDPTTMEMFYPGDRYVDWIGADGYDRQQHGRASFGEQFASWYKRFAPRGKPMIITETGATTDQPEFLQGVAETMPERFPRIKAFLYFDSVGSETDWRLSSYGGAGLPAFAELGRDPYFAPMPKP